MSLFNEQPRRTSLFDASSKKTHSGIQDLPVFELFFASHDRTGFGAFGGIFAMK